MTLVMSGREGAGIKLSCAHLRAGPSAPQCCCFCVSFSYRESDLFLIFCTGGAERCMCYGPYVETCLSTASQMVPNNTQRIHLETFIGSVYFESTGSYAYCDVIPYLL